LFTENKICERFKTSKGTTLRDKNQKKKKQKMKNETIKGIKLLKKGIKDLSGKYIPCWFSVGERYEKNSDGIRSTYMAAVIYAKKYSDRLPKELMPENESDMMTDYFEKDKAVFRKGTKEFEIIAQLLAA
jgi:hypothetical protein